MTSYQEIRLVEQRFHGYVYESAGIVFAFFNDPEEAESCACQLTRLLHHEVDVCGGQITIQI